MNSFGRIFRISIFGESHGKSIGIIIDGCPPGINFTEESMLSDISRRKSGSKGTTPRNEADIPNIISGVFNGKTTGAPISIIFENQNIRSKDYSFVKDTPRPGHADFVAEKKYKGFQDYRGGGHFSGRLTLALVAAGVLAKKIIYPLNPVAKILEVGGFSDIEKGIEYAIKHNDSIGGIVECMVSNMIPGLGEPFFDSLESYISHLVFSIPAIKGIEFGSGFSNAKMFGSQANDIFIDEKGTTATNNNGGINGGISNGNELVFRIAVKPTSSISKSQETYNFRSKQIEKLNIKGRHDLCIALRVPPVLEAVTAIALADLMLIDNG
jgi:chorismate synthase